MENNATATFPCNRTRRVTTTTKIPFARQKSNHVSESAMTLMFGCPGNRLDRR
jgi:hypothetical protein